MFKDYKDIPAKYRRVILDETLEKRIKNIPLAECIEIVEDYIEFEKTNESLKNYEIIVAKNGRSATYVFTDCDEAFRKLDEIIGYVDKDKNILAILKQADRVIRGYVRGRWIQNPPKDKIIVKQMERV